MLRLPWRMRLNVRIRMRMTFPAGAFSLVVWVVCRQLKSTHRAAVVLIEPRLEAVMVKEMPAGHLRDLSLELLDTHWALLFLFLVHIGCHLHFLEFLNSRLSGRGRSHAASVLLGESRDEVEKGVTATTALHPEKARDLEVQIERVEPCIAEAFKAWEGRREAAKISEISEISKTTKPAEGAKGAHGWSRSLGLLALLRAEERVGSE